METNYFRPQKIGHSFDYKEKFNTKEECEKWIAENIRNLEHDPEERDKWYAQGCTVVRYDSNSGSLANTWRFQ
jgi:hypothetical protein